MNHSTRQKEPMSKKAKLYWAIGIIVAVLVAALLIWHTFFFDNQNAVAATVGDQEFTTTEVAYYYNTTANTYLAQAQQYQQMGMDMGYDTSLSPSEQMYNEEKGITYADYFLEQALNRYTGTVLYGSHDRYFINRFATRVWELENGVITDYPMGFARYRQVKALEAQNKIDHTPKAVKEKTVTEKPKPNRSAQQARRQLTICEKEISAQETAIAEIEQRLEEAGGEYERYSEIYKEKEAAEQKLSELMEKWETLAEQAGE